MCFSSPKAPSSSGSTYVPAPTPTSIQSAESGAQSQEARRKKLQNMRSGLASTIATLSSGVVGKSGDLLKTASLSAGKTKLGQ